MAIEKFSFKKVPVDSGGKAYDSLESFQASMLDRLIGATDVNQIPALLVNKKSEVIEILELTLDARPTARGVPKKRKPKIVPPTDDLLAKVTQ